MKTKLLAFVFLYIILSVGTAEAQTSPYAQPSTQNIGTITTNTCCLDISFDVFYNGPDDVTLHVIITGSGILQPDSSTPTSDFTMGPSNDIQHFGYFVTAPNFVGVFSGSIIAQDVADPSSYALFQYSGNSIPPVGVSDFVEMSPSSGGPSTFSPIKGSPIPPCPLPFCPITYAAKFRDFDGNGTTGKTWQWTIQLYHTRGSYTVISTNSSQPSDSSVVTIYSAFTLPSGLDWSRDANGNVVAKVSVDCIDSDGFGHHAEQIVGVLDVPSTLKTFGTLACPPGRPSAKCAVTVEFWDSSGKLTSQTTTSDATGHFEVTMNCAKSNHKSERFVVSSLCCANTWTIPTNHCNGDLRTLVCKECGPCVPPPPLLVDWWRFDESVGPVALETAGTVKNSGAYKNGPAPAPGKVDNALCFNGTDNFVVVGDDQEVNFLGNCNNGTAESFTIALWVKTHASGIIPDKTTTQGHKKNSVATTIADLRVLLDKRTTQGHKFLRGYSLFISDGLLGFQMATGPGNSICGSPGSACTNYVSPAGKPNVDLRDDQWHFVAVTVMRCGAGVGKLYVDGALVYSFAPLTDKIANQAKLQIGRRDPALNASYFAGCMDELQIFKTALNKADLDAIFYAGSWGECKPQGPPRVVPNATTKTLRNR
jgi:concanavalin A-like lectin/glucanase superfamily protein